MHFTLQSVHNSFKRKRSGSFYQHDGIAEKIARQLIQKGICVAIKQAVRRKMSGLFAHYRANAYKLVGVLLRNNLPNLGV